MREPSELQRQAINHLSGPAQVIAGPGSGKTFVITCRILHLIRQHRIPPEQILVITYTKAAAQEMKERFGKAWGAGAGETYNSVNFGTFHSICYNILRQSGISQSSSLIKEKDKRKLLQILLGNHGFSSKCTYDNISFLINTISRMKNLGDSGSPEQFQENADFSFQELCLLKEEYDSYLLEQNMLDFDDMITRCLRLLLENSSVRGKYQNMFSFILVDEFQDINSPQYEILKLLALPENNLFVVGDDDQGIYGFRGAKPEIMKRFMTDFFTANVSSEIPCGIPLKGRQFFLTENYRSGAAVVKLADQMIQRNQARFPKEFHPKKTGGKVTLSCFATRKEEEMCLLKELSCLRTDLLPDIAIILRTNIEVVQYAELLKGAGIAVKGTYLSKENLFHGFIMEDMVSFLCYLYEGRKRKDFIGFMNKPDRFFTRTALLHETVKQEDMEQYYRKNPAMLMEIGRFFGQMQIAASLQPYLALSFFRKTLGYDGYLRQKARDYGECQRWMSRADRIQSCFKEYACGISIRQFMEEQADRAGEACAKTVNRAGVSILTMHGAKGLEFSKVFLPDVNEGVIPGRESIRAGALEEERRLLYVAITRAKEDLFIYYTKERNRKLSRFLEGLIPV
ncbi:MAG: ATP-dependent helicase [Lachnospiraceae bacterium]|nr:ATP-dependent helicase [Lachnospiraceae bacterium]